MSNDRLLISELVSDGVRGLASTSRRILGTPTPRLSVYIHTDAGNRTIGGGRSELRAIRSLAIDTATNAWMQQQIRALADTLGISVQFTQSSSDSNLDVYLCTDLKFNNASTLGVTLNNDNGKQAWSELLLNGSLLNGNAEVFNYTFRHELGHVLGLEHPFDPSDGDSHGEAFKDPDGNQTLMSYTRPGSGWPDGYTASDWLALISIWGLNMNHSFGWLFSTQSGDELVLYAIDVLDRLANSKPGDQFKGAVNAASPPHLAALMQLANGQTDVAFVATLVRELCGVLSEASFRIWGKQMDLSSDILKTKAIVLPNSSSGTKAIIDNDSSPVVLTISQGSADHIQIQASVNIMLNASAKESYAAGLAAFNIGSKTAKGTGQIIPLKGLGQYTFVATAIPEATTIINLEPTRDTAFFLHDAFSSFYGGLRRSPDYGGCYSHQRILNVDSIIMGSGGGTSIVDLSSKDYVTGEVTVYGAINGRSIFWGTDANDSFVSRGGDSVIFGGAGTNTAALGAGRDTVQYRAGVVAIDRIEGFDPTRDVLELWSLPEEQVPDPSFSKLNDSTLVAWGGSVIELVGVKSASINLLSRSSNIAPGNPG